MVVKLLKHFEEKLSNHMKLTFVKRYALSRNDMRQHLL